MNVTIHRRACVVFALVACISVFAGLASPLLATGASPADDPTITFRKVFKSSYPEFVEIKISQSGAGTYDIRQMDDAPAPQSMQIDATLVQSIFSLAGKLHNFDGVDLEMHRRIANLGEKTFIYSRGAETHQVTFNYTLDQTASQLLQIFDGLSRQETDLANLERTMRYDRLGVNDVVRQIEDDYNKKLLPEPRQLLSALDRLAADDHYIDIARQRARTIASRIRSDN